jgi:glycosyltransferase involved in cell wall biosynthesis
MRVLHVVPYYAPAWAWGGVVTAVTGLCRAQARAGHRVSVLTTDTLGPSIRGPAGGDVLDGVEIWRVPTRAVALRARFNLSWPRGFAAAAGRIIRDRAIEVVHCHELRSVETVTAVKVAARHHLPVLLSPHGTLPLGTGRSTLKASWDRLLSRRVLPRIRHVVALSESEANEARRLWNAHRLELAHDRLSIVPNGVEPAAPVDAGERHRARRGLDLADTARVVLYLGRLHPRKNLLSLIEAFATLSGRRPEARLLLAGRDDGALAGIHQSMTRHGIGARVVVVGMVDDRGRREVLAAADVLASVGIGEGMPMAALEALMVGVPVVLAEEWGMGEAITAGAGAISGHEPSAIAAALERMLDAGDDARDRARTVAMARFVWPVVASRLDRVLEGIVRNAAQAAHRD